MGFGKRVAQKKYDEMESNISVSVSRYKRIELSTDFSDFECEKCVSVSEWVNGEGVDISISHSHRSDTFSFTWNEFDAMVALCNLAHLDYGEEEEQ